MDLSVVFPCLNEEQTLGFCIGEVRNALESTGISYEIVVADNGSTDGSMRVAESAGARVVPVAEKGYGAAVNGGIVAAQGKYAIFADADGSYRLGDAPALYRKAEEASADMVVASRLKGEIEPGAMPPLHRYLGTPVLTWLINRLYGGRLSDCNSGFRCVRRDAYESWGIRASGMEFASELLVKALKHRAVIVEVRSGLRPDRRSRPPHLRTWRDGMRHLLFILSERPELFEWTGLALLVATSLLQVLAFAVGPTRIGCLNVFDYHSQALLIPLGCAGIQLYLFSCYLFLSGTDHSTALTRNLLRLNEAWLLLLLLGLCSVEGLGLLWILWKWTQSHFANIDLIRAVLFVTHFLCVLGFLSVGLLGIHVFKNRYRQLGGPLRDGAGKSG
ncbi:MAG: hypothetical protein A3K19_12895 [Lentisphaerae bacterium RIFOXYB12_FULL_65_16]|nr:MAG: hypothetical protein A3K18_04810 [Lentisphaerae bacterium RIFOXYA12_64_32]OGV87209.1 MAG: hypothetical protein A3K19_12895 [Lentisphaerae bacterium RIFOXYB12_FULL_65_16]